MKTAPMTTIAQALLVSIASATITLGARAQETTTSFDGPPKQIDENATPEGIGFNQQGGELSSIALEQAAIGNPTVHYHYYDAPPSNSRTANAQPSASDALPADAAPSTEPGYAPNTMVTPITNSMNTSWHLYKGNIGGISPSPTGQALATNAGGNSRGGSTNFYIPNGTTGYTPSIDNVAYGSGAFVGNWDPYAANGTGSVQGFD